jgi:hypothetical protein
MSRYNLKIENFIPILSDDDIYEPGENLIVPGINFRNNGGMHTPIYQPIIVSLENNKWVEFNNQKGKIGLLFCIYFLFKKIVN